MRAIAVFCAFLALSAAAAAQTGTFSGIWESETGTVFTAGSVFTGTFSITSVGADTDGSPESAFYVLTGTISASEGALSASTPLVSANVNDFPSEELLRLSGDAGTGETLVLSLMSDGTTLSGDGFEPALFTPFSAWVDGGRLSYTTSNGSATGTIREFQVVPEPASLLVLGLGLIGLRRRFTPLGSR